MKQLPTMNNLFSFGTGQQKSSKANWAQNLEKVAFKIKPCLLLRTVLVNTHISYFMSVWQKDQKLWIYSTIRGCLSFQNFFGQLKLFSVDGWPPIDFFFKFNPAWIFLKEQGYGMGKLWESATFLTKIHRLKLFFIKV